MLNIIDVSEANGTIDWTKVKDQIDGAVLRAGYRGYGWAGALVTDKQLHDNVAKCRILKIPYGVYWLSQATSNSEALAEAEYLHAQIRSYTDMSLPVWLDSEYGEALHGTGRADKINKASRTEYALTFLNKLRDYGYRTGLYTGPAWFTDMIDGEAIRADGHYIWLASVEYVKPKIAYDAWQYSWKGQYDGIQTDVDRSYFSSYLDNRKGKYYLDTKGHWAEKAIDTATDNGLMTGKGGDLFDPDAAMTRAEVATVLARLLEREKTKETNT